MSAKGLLLKGLKVFGLSLRSVSDPLGSPNDQKPAQYIISRENARGPKISESRPKGDIPVEVIDTIFAFYDGIDPFYEGQNAPDVLQIGGAWRKQLSETRAQQLAAIKNKDKRAYRGLLENMFFNELMVGLWNYDRPRAGAPVNYDFLIECDAFERIADRPRSDLAVSNAVAMPGLKTEDGGVVRYTDPQHGCQAAHILRLLDLSHKKGKACNILDLGSGFGGLAEKLAAWGADDKRPLRMYLCDIPLNMTTAYAYLSACFGVDQVVLIKDAKDLNDVPKNAQFVCVPSLFAKELSAQVDFDVMHNGKSFSEMDQATVDFYIQTFVQKDMSWLLHTNSNRQGSENYGGHEEVIARNIELPKTHQLVSRFQDSRPGRYVLSVYGNRAVFKS